MRFLSHSRQSTRRAKNLETKIIFNFFPVGFDEDDSPMTTKLVNNTHRARESRRKAAQKSQRREMLERVWTQRRSGRRQQQQRKCSDSCELVSLIDDNKISSMTYLWFVLVLLHTSRRRSLCSMILFSHITQCNFMGSEVASNTFDIQMWLSFFFWHLQLAGVGSRSSSSSSG